MKQPPRPGSLSQLLQEDQEPQPPEPAPVVVWPFPRTLHPETLRVLPFNLDNFEDALL